LPTEKELYTIKKLKTFKGMEGMGGFNLDLCRKGKKIAECINDDTGGDTMFYFINRDEEKIGYMQNVVGIHNNVKTKKCSLLCNMWLKYTIPYSMLFCAI